MWIEAIGDVIHDLKVSAYQRGLRCDGSCELAYLGQLAVILRRHLGVYGANCIVAAQDDCRDHSIEPPREVRIVRQCRQLWQQDFPAGLGASNHLTTT